MRAQENVWYLRIEVIPERALVSTRGLRGVTVPKEARYVGLRA